MPLLGNAALAMFWNMEPARRSEFEDWHSHEHLPERLGIPGFLRGSRWADAEGGEGFFVMYELQAYETLTSPPYIARLNDPTPWSTKMMPLHRDMVRSQCRVAASFGGAVAGLMLTLRLSPAPGGAEPLEARLRVVLGALAGRLGIAGSHLLITQTPDIPATKEQAIRSHSDAVADWIVLVAGIEPRVLQDLARNELGERALGDHGALSAREKGIYRLRHAVTPGDL